MAPNDVWMLTVKGTVTGQQHIHTLHFLQGDGGVDGAHLITSWTSAASAAYRGCFATTQGPVQSIQAKLVCGTEPFPAPTEVIPVASDQLGTRGVAGDPMPSFVAGLIQEKGALAGRRYSGRFFLGGLYETDVIANDLASAWLTVAAAYCTALKTAFVTPALPAWRLFCFSSLLAEGDTAHTSRPTTPGGPRVSTPVTAVPCAQAGSQVTDLVVSARPTTMRSRKLGHGI